MTNGDSENDMKPIDCIYGYRNSKPDWCPLNQLPKKDDFDDPYDAYYTGYSDGWNKCLKGIVGE